jgi:hypothetical protein
MITTTEVHVVTSMRQRITPRRHSARNQLAVSLFGRSTNNARTTRNHAHAPGSRTARSRQANQKLQRVPLAMSEGLARREQGVWQGRYSENRPRECAL